MAELYWVAVRSYPPGRLSWANFSTFDEAWDLALLYDGSWVYRGIDESGLRLVARVAVLR